MAAQRKDDAAPLVREGWVKLPRPILFHPKLSAQAKVMYAALVHYCGPRPYCWPSHRRLAKDLGIGQRTVAKWLDQLKAAGLIDVEQQGDGRNARIYVQPCPFGQTTEVESQEEAEVADAHSLARLGTPDRQAASERGREECRQVLREKGLLP